MIKILSAGFASLSLSSWDGAPAAAEEEDLGLAENEDEAEEDITMLSLFYVIFIDSWVLAGNWWR